LIFWYLTYQRYTTKIIHYKTHLCQNRMIMLSHLSVILFNMKIASWGKTGPIVFTQDEFCNMHGCIKCWWFITQFLLELVVFTGVLDRVTTKEKFVSHRVKSNYYYNTKPVSLANETLPTHLLAPHTCVYWPMTRHDID